MNPQTSPLLRWLAPVGLGICLLAGATGAPAQNSDDVMVFTFEDAMEVAAESSPTMIRGQWDLEQTYISLKRSEADLKLKLNIRLNPYDYNRSEQYEDYVGEWYTTERQTSSVSFDVDQPIRWTDGTLSLSNNLNYTRNSNSRKSGVDTNFQSGLSLTYSQPLFQPNQYKMDMESLQNDVRNAEIQFIETSMNLERDVTNWCFSLYQAKNALETAKNDFDRSETNLQVAQNKVDAGLIAQNELNQQLITYAESEMAYEDAIQALEDAKDDFKINLGLPLDQEVDIDLEIDFIPVELDADFVVELALANSFQLEQQEMSLREQENSLIRTKASDKITGDFSLTYGLRSTEEEFGDLYSDIDQDQQFSFGVNVPVYDGGIRKLGIQSAQIRYDQQVMNAEENRKNLIRNTRSAVRDLNKQIRSYELDLQNLDLSQKTYDIAAEQFANGELTAMELQQQQEQLTSKQRGIIQSRINYKLALLQLKIDTLYDFEQGQPVDVNMYLVEED